MEGHDCCWEELGEPDPLYAQCRVTVRKYAAIGESVSFCIFNPNQLQISEPWKERLKRQVVGMVGRSNTGEIMDRKLKKMPLKINQIKMNKIKCSRVGYI